MATTLVEHVVADAGAFLRKAPLQVSLSLLIQVDRVVRVGLTRERGFRDRGVSARRAGGRGLSVEPEANRSPTTNRETGSSSAFTGTINDPGP